MIARNQTSTYLIPHQSFNLPDLQCYRLHGHNQHDEPRFTNPVMYRTIDDLIPLHSRIVNELITDEVLPGVSGVFYTLLGW